jgi:integrase
MVGDCDMASIRKRQWKTAAGEQKQAWIVDYADQSGVRRLKTFPTKKAADAWSVGARHQVAQGTHTAESASITVKAAADLWLERARAEGLERGTAIKYEQHARVHICPVLGREKLANLTTPKIEAFVDHLRATGMSHAMVRKVLVSLKAILAESVRRGLVAMNVAQPVRLRARTREEGKVTIPSRQEVEAILQAATPDWRPFLTLAARAGLRMSELRGLEWSAIDLDAKLIHVRQRADGWGTIGTPKSKAGHRSIPMSPSVHSELLQWKLRCPRIDGQLGLVFPNRSGKPWSLSNVAVAGFRNTQKRAGIAKPYHLHSLRHFCASVWIEAGFSPKRLQSLLGHSSITITFDRYGHLFPSAEDDFARMARAELA